jgi:hypothetical protein
LRQLRRNGSFEQPESGAAGVATDDGKIKGRNVRLEAVVVFQWVMRRFRNVRYFPAMCAGVRKQVLHKYIQCDGRNVRSAVCALGYAAAPLAAILRRSIEQAMING